jgi:hypothetical protein
MAQSSVKIGNFNLSLTANKDTNTQKSVFKATNSKGATLHFEAFQKPASNTSSARINLDTEDEDIKDIFTHLDTNKNKKLDANELSKSKLEAIEGVTLIDNHAFRSQATRKFEASGVRFQWQSPKNLLGLNKSGVLDFADDIVSVGTDDSGKIVTFICPRVTKTAKLPLGLGVSASGEVEIGQVAGRLDPITGKGTIYLDDVNWKFWGSIQTKTFNGVKDNGVSEANAASAPVEAMSGPGALIVLDNITPGAYAGQDKSKIFSSYLVKAAAGTRPSQPLIQTLMLGAVNDIIFPGLLDKGTTLQWNIDLKSPIAVNGLS